MFATLAKLPADCVVYYEPRISCRNPDFVVLLPDLGVLIIEVKGWYPAAIVAADNQRVVVRAGDTETQYDHPDVQAKRYKFSLMDYCRTHRRVAGNLFEDGSGRFRFPFSHMTVLSNISDRQLSQAEWRMVFPAELCVSKDTLAHWEHLSDGEAVKAELFRFFNPFWKFPRLNEDQMLRLRTIIHPEILIHTPGLVPSSETIKALDLQQERNARSLGDGHRIIYGIAGSGKTVVLIARARLLSQQNPNSRILVLCYNVTLRVYLAECLKDVRNVRVANFHRWANLPFIKDESDADHGERWLAELTERRTGEAGKYDTILVDEAQDFSPVWFRCVVAALKDPEHGDLLIVHDSSQGLYGDRKVRWKDVGVRAQGRTERRDLSRNYRNTGEILSLAAQFARRPSNDDSEETASAIPVDPALCAHRFHMPMLFSFRNRTAELRAVQDIVRRLQIGEFEPLPGYRVPPSDIGILYRLRSWNPEFQTLADSPNITWLNRTAADRRKVCDDNTKLLTIHSSKGLQFRVVIVICSDEMPTRFPNTDAETERSFLYVALTRAEELLILTYTGTSDFVRELESSSSAERFDIPEFREDHSNDTRR